MQKYHKINMDTNMLKTCKYRGNMCMELSYEPFTKKISGADIVHEWSSLKFLTDGFDMVKYGEEVTVMFTDINDHEYINISKIAEKMNKDNPTRRHDLDAWCWLHRPNMKTYSEILRVKHNLPNDFEFFYYFTGEQVKILDEFENNKSSKKKRNNQHKNHYAMITGVYVSVHIYTDLYATLNKDFGDTITHILSKMGICRYT